MSSTIQWVGIDDAAKAVSISPTTLRQLQRSGELTPGEAWVWLTGCQGGPIGWNVDGIKAWQVQRTKDLQAAVKEKAANIETFDS